MDGLETQISGLRGDVNARFTALHGEMNERFAAMQAQMDSRFDAVEQGLISLHAQFADLHRHMLVLHEDVIDRISRIKS